MTPPRRQPWFMLTRHHVVALAEIDGIVGFDRALGFFAVERSRNVGIFHKAETHRHPPKALAERLDMKPALGAHAWRRGKLHRQRDGLLIERAHLAHVIGDQLRNKAPQPGQENRAAGNTRDLMIAQLADELPDRDGVALLAPVHGVDAGVPRRHHDENRHAEQ